MLFIQIASLEIAIEYAGLIDIIRGFMSGLVLDPGAMLTVCTPSAVIFHNEISYSAAALIAAAVYLIKRRRR